MIVTQSGPPVREFDERIVATEYRLEHDMTAYRLVVLDSPDQVVLLASWGGDPLGRWWAMPGSARADPVAWTYLAEKLALREGDRPGWTTICRMAGIVVR